MRTKAEDIRMDLADIDCQKNTSGVRTLEDRKKLLSSYKQLALDCVRTQIFAELEVQSLLPVQEQAANCIVTM